MDSSQTMSNLQNNIFSDIVTASLISNNIVNFDDINNKIVNNILNKRNILSKINPTINEITVLSSIIQLLVNQPELKIVFITANWDKSVELFNLYSTVTNMIESIKVGQFNNTQSDLTNCNLIFININKLDKNNTIPGVDYVIMYDSFNSNMIKKDPNSYYINMNKAIFFTEIDDI